MNVFVVGCTGLIGGHAARAMAAAGHRVVGLARSDAALSSRSIAAIRGDVEDRDALARGIEDADTVLFAPSVGDAETAVVDWMLGHMATSGKTLIFCSGTGVLGQRTGIAARAFNQNEASGNGGYGLCSNGHAWHRCCS